ncbi:hypothetical protein EMCRGX_G028041 [Ephydatia muelleri]
MNFFSVHGFNNRIHIVTIQQLCPIVFEHKLDEQDFYKCPDRLRLPLIFYIGHTATLYINKLSLAGLVRASLRDGSSDGFQHPVLQANINLKYGSSTGMQIS